MALVPETGTGPAPTAAPTIMVTAPMDTLIGTAEDPTGHTYADQPTAGQL